MKPSLAKGTRDFSAAEVQKRQYIMNVLREQFELRGYDPIETPSFENIETLTGKYGEEGDRLIFKILRSGDFTSKIDEGLWADKNPKALTSKVADKALRYDLTVPFARYVVQHQNELAFPFKRYQMQPVWRADRPQKGRFREFYQCDVDVIGSNSLLNEVELVQIINDVFDRLKINTVVKINNRKILSGIAEVIGAQDKIIDINNDNTFDEKDKISLISDTIVDGISDKVSSMDFDKVCKPVLSCCNSAAVIMPIDSNIIACANDACTSYLAICISISLSLPTVKCSIFLSIENPLSHNFILIPAKAGISTFII